MYNHLIMSKNPKKINTKKQTNEASDSPKQKTKAQLENELLEKAEAELKVLELNKHQNKDSGSTSLEQKSITELEFETEPQIKKPNNEDSNSAPSEQKTVAQLKIELKIAEAKLKDLELKKHKNEDFSSASLIQETIAELKNEIEIAEAKIS
ncbi:uncharacterized protein LOC126840657 [Adelges cooleyi]|uniref:uncharacterized protein LOC126840657 n=1 Tax=Adelges cooleyi TaxID=133065 RepID=UPI00217F9D0D|nr:uncharacterized protein LOC126840657 [Adelges cooleyi]